MNKPRDFDNFNHYAKNYRYEHNKSIQISGADSNYFSEYKTLELLRYENSNDTFQILDFGCGDGNSIAYLKKHFPNSTICGIDISEKSIDLAQKKWFENTSFKVFNGKEIPFENGKFDIVFVSMVFHHVENKFHQPILKEIYRVLKEKGRLYNFEHNSKNILTRRIVKECPFDKNVKLLPSSYCREITRLSGFKIDQLNFTLFFPRHRFFRLFFGLEIFLNFCPFGAQYYIRAIK